MNESKIQLNDEILYSEWVPAGRFLKFTSVFIILFSIPIGILIVVLFHIELAIICFVFGTINLFISLMYWNYRGLKIILTYNQLEINYGIFNHKRIPMSRITSCVITKAKFRTYGGVGVRFGLDGSWIYNTDLGEAVKLTFQSGRPFVFSTRNPQEICNLINELST